MGYIRETMREIDASRREVRNGFFSRTDVFLVNLDFSGRRRREERERAVWIRILLSSLRSSSLSRLLGL